MNLHLIRDCVCSCAFILAVYLRTNHARLRSPFSVRTHPRNGHRAFVPHPAPSSPQEVRNSAFADLVRCGKRRWYHRYASEFLVVFVFDSGREREREHPSRWIAGAAQRAPFLNDAEFMRRADLLVANIRLREHSISPTP